MYVHALDGKRIECSEVVLLGYTIEYQFPKRKRKTRLFVKIGAAALLFMAFAWQNVWGILDSAARLLHVGEPLGYVMTAFWEDLWENEEIS